MGSQFNEKKLTEAAALFLKLRGGKMHYLKLLKLLYLADREALLRWGRPISTDRYVSMKHGPVLSNAYDLISEEPAPEEHGIWAQFISAPTDYEVRLLRNPPNDELSPAEENLIREIFQGFGYRNRWDLRDYTHSLPEWKDPNGSSIPIKFREIFIAGNRSEEEASEMERELESLAVAQELLAIS